MIVLAQTVFWMGRIIDYALLGRVLLSWIVMLNRGGESILTKIYDVLVKYTEPIVSPVRNLINKYFRTSIFDWSILATMLIVGLVVNIVVKVLLMLA